MNYSAYWKYLLQKERKRKEGSVVKEVEEGEKNKKKKFG